MTRLRLAALLAAFAGGLGAVGAEVVFTRRMAMLFGVTAPAVGTVVAVYLGGMALGSALGGRMADRLGDRAPWLYAGAEGFALLWALLFLPLCGAFDAVSAALPLEAAVAAAAVGTVVLVGPAAVASGATFPALSRVVGDEADVRLLVAANTLGAALGSVLAGFVWPHTLGYRASLWLAGGIALTAGVGMIAVTGGRAVPAPRRLPLSTLPISARAAALAYGVLGGAAMVAEVGWTRLLEQTGANPGALTFPLVLTAYLLGYGLGGAIVEPRLRRLGERPGLAVCLALSGVACAAGVGILPFIPPEPVVGHQTGWAPGNEWIFAATGVLVSADRLAVVLAAVALPGLASGAGFPLVASALTRRTGGLGAGVGSSWAAGTAAAVLASLWMGFLPEVGPGTIHLLGMVGVTALVAAAALARRRVAWVLPALGAAALWVPSTAGLQIQEGETVLRFRETAAGPTAVTQAPSQRGTEVQIYTHGERVTGYPLNLSIPLLLHPDPSRVLLIAFGSGVNVRGVLRDPAVDELVCVDIDPALPEMALALPAVGDVFADPRARFVNADGRHLLRLSEPRWDIIYNDVATYAQYVELGTVEFFTLARERLAPGGLFVAKLHTDTLTPRGQARFLRTFLSVFPNALLFDAHGALPVLVGMTTEHLDHDAFVARTQDTFSVYGERARRDIEFMTVLDAAGLNAMARGRPNTDDRPMPLRHVLHGPFVSEESFGRSGQPVFYAAARKRGEPAINAAFGLRTNARPKPTRRSRTLSVPPARRVPWGRTQVSRHPEATVDW